MRALPTVVTALVLAGSLALAGCSSPRPDDADTVDGPAVTSTAAPSDDTAAESPAPVVEAASLTQEQIDAALLTQADMGEGWSTDSTAAAQDDTAQEDAEDLATYEPAECKAILNDMDTASDEAPLAQGKAAFATQDYALFVQSIETWDSTVDESKLDELVAGLSACSNVVQTDPDGTVTTSTIAALDMPNFGDRTFAARIAASTPVEGVGDMTFTMDFVVVITGTSSVSFVAGGFTPLDPAVLQGLITTGMTKVASV